MSTLGGYEMNVPKWGCSSPDKVRTTLSSEVASEKIAYPCFLGTKVALAIDGVVERLAGIVLVIDAEVGHATFPSYHWNDGEGAGTQGFVVGI